MPDPQATVIVPNDDHPTVIVPDAGPTDFVPTAWSHDDEEAAEDEHGHPRALLRGAGVALAVLLPATAIVLLTVFLWRAEHTRTSAPAAAPPPTATAPVAAKPPMAPNAMLNGEYRLHFLNSESTITGPSGTRPIPPDGKPDDVGIIGYSTSCAADVCVAHAYLPSGVDPGPGSNAMSPPLTWRDERG